MPRRRPDLELRAGSSAHYEDPAYYAQAYRARTDDVRYYEALSRERGGPVLEYGCGNGRLALPIARAGVPVLGVDLSAAMLADLRARARQEPLEVRERLRVRRGDMRTVRLGQRFPLVVCGFNTLLHLYERQDFERFFARVREHLAPRGELVLDLSLPDLSLLSRSPDRPIASPRFRYPGGGVVRYAERFDYDPARQILFMSLEFRPEDGSAPFATPLTHRQIFPQEMLALLHYNGFDVREVWGGFDRRPLAEVTDTVVVHARAAGSFSPRSRTRTGTRPPR